MKEIILLKLGEIVLKGLNRSRFEDTLLKNVRRAVKKYGECKVYSKQSTIFVDFADENADVDAAFEACGKIFGIVSLTKAIRCGLSFDEVKKVTNEYLGDRLSRAKTFKVEARRADKAYPMTSPQIMTYLGESILNTFENLTVDLFFPEITVYAEVREGFVFIHANPTKGAGGLPTGTSGHALLMLSGGIDSPVAGYMMAKRGLRVSAIHFESPPYTSERAREKVVSLTKILSEYTGVIDLFVVPFTEIQENIKNKCPEELFTVIMRRYMLKIACLAAEKYGAKAIITGESLGQVASQTLGAINCTDCVSDIPVFRPLIGNDKQDIIDIARKIGTMETSSLPYEDCCTVFTPKHPKTNPSVEEVVYGEEKLDEKALLDGICDRIERITLSWK